MPNDAKENRIEDAISTELAKIGDVPANWLTTPTYAIGVPPDPLPQGGANQFVYLQYLRTEPLPEGEGATATHLARATWLVWMVSTKTTSLNEAWRDVKKLKADVLRALYAGEAAIIAAGADLGSWQGPHEMRGDLARAGAVFGVLEVFADFHLEHADP